MDIKEPNSVRKEKTGLEDYLLPNSDLVGDLPGYSESSARYPGPSTSSSVVVASPLGNGVLPIAALTPSVPTNGVRIITVLEPIKGSWLLDPLAAQPSGPSILQTLAENRVGRRPRRVRNLNVIMGTPTAKFDSRHGNISASLRIVGESAIPATATINSTTRSGNIVLELVSKSTTRTVQFDAYSRSGNISLLIPRNFSGLIELRSRNGATQLLPALASSVRIVRATNRETVVFVGNEAFPQVDPTGTRDLARLFSHSGCVRLGFSGEDAFNESEGVIAKATHLFQKLTTRSAGP
jgi:hypothetical protein